MSLKKYPPRDKIKILLNIIIKLNNNASFCFSKVANKFVIGEWIKRNKIHIANSCAYSPATIQSFPNTKAKIKSPNTVIIPNGSIPILKSF